MSFDFDSSALSDGTAQNYRFLQRSRNLKFKFVEFTIFSNFVLSGEESGKKVKIVLERKPAKIA